MTKHIFVYNPKRPVLSPRGEQVWLPTFWSQAKTYYEHIGSGDWNWVNPIIDMYSHDDDIAFVKDYIAQHPPSIFGISLYVWNSAYAHKIAAWVKSTWPNCIVISGGPHQYVKTDLDWFQKHPYLDASLPGDCYGEWCLTQIMQQLDQGTVNWDLIDTIYVPRGNSKIPYQKNPDTRDIKKNFDYNWPSFAKQQVHLADFLKHAKQTKFKIISSAVLETTRGCPYGCTFCDWGGGINSKVKVKDISFVKQDIDALASLDISKLYVADANFGILGDRDIEILKHMVNGPDGTSKFKNISFGGFAKTNKRLDTLKTMASLIYQEKEEEYREVKISIQSFDQEVLRNIERTNITLEEYMQVFDLKTVNDSTKLVVVELIMGLPGMTMSKFYKELDILYQHNLNATWYSWNLLPEAPAFLPSYREKFKLKTVNKDVAWNGQDTGDVCVVVASYSYTEHDYLEMLIAQGWYFSIHYGGILGNCLSCIENRYTIGNIIQRLTNDSGLKQFYQTEWQQILQDKNLPALVTVPGKIEPAPFDDKIYPGHLIPTLWFWNPNMIAESTKRCLIDLGCEESIVDKDIDNIVNYLQNPEKWSEFILAWTWKKNAKGRLMLKNNNF